MEGTGRTVLRITTVIATAATCLAMASAARPGAAPGHGIDPPPTVFRAPGFDVRELAVAAADE